jgi:RHS repeat-associated protein
VSASGSPDYFPTYDGNGNISEYLSISGTVESHYEYDPFGTLTRLTRSNSTRFQYRFSTKPRDINTGLYYYGYRWYDPLTGRWPSRDPIEESGGLNLYGFVGNDVVNGMDRWGLAKVTVDLSFVENDIQDLSDQNIEIANLSFWAGFWGYLRGFAPGHVSVSLRDYNNRDKVQAKGYWDALKDLILKQLGKDDCIEKIIIRGHGNAKQWGGIWNENVDKEGRPENEFFKWIKERKCADDCSINILTCGCAGGDYAQNRMIALAVVTGFKVIGNDGLFIVIGMGSDFVASPDGTINKINPPEVPNVIRTGY